MNILKELSELNEGTIEKKNLREFISVQSIKIKAFGEVLSMYNKPEMLQQMPPLFVTELRAIKNMQADVTHGNFVGWLSSKGLGLPIGHHILLENAQNYSSSNFSSSNRNKF